jgi:hypothetical protein
MFIDLPRDISMEELEHLCAKVLGRLTLTRSPTGYFELQISEAEEEAVSNMIIFKRSHYIDNRYFQLTASITPDGLLIEAYEPDKDKLMTYPIRCSGPIENNAKTF